VLERYREATLLEALPDTGRTHQIRVHAAAVDHPVAGDERYGDAEFNAWMRARCGLRRLFLHAHALGFTCPSSGEAVTVSTPLAEDLRRAVEALSPR
jgi:23S rRNA pseudouridine955/2504/2580 synthase